MRKDQHREVLKNVRCELAVALGYRLTGVRAGPQPCGRRPKLRVTGRDLNKNLSVHLSAINSRPDHETDQSAEERAQSGVLDYEFKRDRHRRSPRPRWINGLRPRSVLFTARFLNACFACGTGRRRNFKAIQ